MEEIWKDIRNYEGLYQVSSHGKVRSLDRVVRNGVGERYANKLGKVLRHCIDSDGYAQVNLSKEGKARTRKVHRLAAAAFLTTYSEDLTVNHVDSNKINNEVTNLNMMTIRENASHFHSKTNKNLGAYYHKPSKKWRAQISLDNKLITIGAYASQEAAAEVYRKTLKEHLDKGGK